MATAKDFTMVSSYVNYDGHNASSAFGWALEGVDLSEIKDIDTEKWVRSYVKGTISGWKQTVDVKASETTIYKVWRSEKDYEFAAFFNYVRQRIEGEFPVFVK